MIEQQQTIEIVELDLEQVGQVAGGAGVRMDGNGLYSDVDRGFGLDPNG